eukprot:XP_020397575.1 extensin-like [Zea mays]
MYVMYGGSWELTSRRNVKSLRREVLSVTFGTEENFRMENVLFDVAEMLSPTGVLTVRGDRAAALAVVEKLHALAAEAARPDNGGRNPSTSGIKAPTKVSKVRPSGADDVPVKAVQLSVGSSQTTRILFPKHRRRPPQNAVVAAAFPSCGAPPPARPGHAPAHRREPRQCSPELARPGHAPARPVHCRPTELARARRRPPTAVQSPPEHRPELAPHTTDQSPRRPESDQSPPPSPHRPLRLR